MSEEMPEREYIINWFGIGSELVQMLKEGLSPIQCIKRLRDKRRREFITRCRDCKYLITPGSACSYWDYCDIESIDGFCAWAERREVGE